MTLIQVLTDPNGFFEEKMKSEVELRTPLLIMLFIGVLGAISAAIMTQKIMAFLPPEAAAFGSIGVIIAVIGAFVGVLFMWILYAGIFYGISSILGGEGDFKRVLEFVAYGFIPSVINSVISIIVIATSFSIDNINIEDPALFQEALLADPTMQIVTLIGIIITLWSANIWIFGLVHARSMTVKNAAISVLVPVGIYILYSASKFLGA